MAWKDPEKRRAAIRKHYYENRKYYIDKSLRKKAALRKWLREEKNKTPCTDCGVQYPYFVTDYDHLENKKMTVSQMVNRGSTKQLKEEVAKCELVCANCHRFRTHKRRSDKNSV